MSVKCGFIGLGSQGAPMARRIIEAWGVADAPVRAVAELRRLLVERRSR